CHTLFPRASRQCSRRTMTTHRSRIVIGAAGWTLWEAPKSIGPPRRRSPGSFYGWAGKGDRMPFVRSSLVLGAVVFVAGAGAPARATDPTAMCKATKLRAAGKEVAGKMGCYQKAKKAGTGVDGRCLSNAQTKAEARIDIAGTSDCPGTWPDIDSVVDNCVAAFIADDPN